MLNFIKRIPARIYIALSGILLGFTLLFTNIGFLAFVVMIPLAMMIYRRANAERYKVGKAYLDGFIFYMSFGVVIFHWFAYFYPLEFAGLSSGEAILVIALAWIGLSALQAAFSAFVFVLISRFTKTQLYKNHPILLAPYAAMLWAVNEWTQTLTWAGVPWGRIAISQTAMPIMMQQASLFGSYFLTFVIVLINFLVAYAILFADKRKMAARVALIVLGAHILCGTVLYLIPAKDEDRSIKVASLQGNFESQLTYDISLETIFVRYEELTQRAAQDGAKLIIWPEGALAVDIYSKIFIKGEGFVKISDAVSNLATSLDVTIVIGTYIDETRTEYYNSVSAFYPDGTSHIKAYTKMKLVPFGEYMPMREILSTLIPPLAEINMLDGDVSFGKEATVFNATNEDNAIKVGTLICFDGIYERIALESARAGAQMLIVPSDDSWFYDSRAMHMHHSQNILRAVEQGKYNVTCGNTGVTSVINDKGAIINSMPICEQGYVIDTVYAVSSRTLYSYIGNLFVYLCIVAAFVPFIHNIWYKKKQK